MRTLIRTMSEANPLWGAPRIHGELLKLGATVSQATVAKYMVRRRRPMSWRCPDVRRRPSVPGAGVNVQPEQQPIPNARSWPIHSTTSRRSPDA
jgi:hypothetical protein